VFDLWQCRIRSRIYLGARGALVQLTPLLVLRNVGTSGKFAFWRPKPGCPCGCNAGQREDSLWSPAWRKVPGAEHHFDSAATVPGSEQNRVCGTGSVCHQPGCCCCSERWLSCRAQETWVLRTCPRKGNPLPRRARAPRAPARCSPRGSQLGDAAQRTDGPSVAAVFPPPPPGSSLSPSGPHPAFSSVGQNPQ